MVEVDTQWEGIPSYLELLSSIFQFVENSYHETYIEKREPLPQGLSWDYYNFNQSDFLLVVVVSLVWTILRHFCTEWVFKPLAHHFALTPNNQRKMPEAAWKFVFYFCAWSYTCYVLILSGNYQFFQKPSTVWEGWSMNATPARDIYLIYIAQWGFYLHALYGTLILDEWRKDFLVMVIHHVLTLALISFSYSLRCHNIGVMVLFLHDVCDVLFEFSKLNVYFKIQGDKLIRRHDILANITFFCFIVTWFVSRLYLFPLRVIYTGTFVVQKMDLVIPCALFMNSLLCVLQIINIYWTLCIIELLFRLATGQAKDVDESMEYDLEKKVLFENGDESRKLHGDALRNGNANINSSYKKDPISNGETAGAARNSVKKGS